MEDVDFGNAANSKRNVECAPASPEPRSRVFRDARSGTVQSRRRPQWLYILYLSFGSLLCCVLR